MAASLRRFLKFAVVNTLQHSGALAAGRWFRRRSDSVCVLGLHRVLDDAASLRTNSQAAIVLREHTFCRLLDHLQARFDLISLRQFLDGARNQPSRPACLLTFDDGWGDNYTRAFPELRRRKVPSAIFLATSLLEMGATFWVEDLRGACRNATSFERVRAAFARQAGAAAASMDVDGMIEYLKHRDSRERDALLAAVLSDVNVARCEEDRMLTWQQIQTMSQEGVEFGGHTVHHVLLPFESDSVVDAELRECRNEISSHLGQEVRGFAYPNGDCDARVRGRVEKAGYACAFTTRRNWYACGSDLYLIPRILLHEGNVTGADGEFSAAVTDFTLLGWR